MPAYKHRSIKGTSGVGTNKVEDAVIEAIDAALADEGDVGIWNHTRVARLGALWAMGKSVGEIAADECIQRTPRAVRDKAQRLGLRFRDVRTPTGIIINLMPGEINDISDEAAVRGMSAEALASRIMHFCIHDDLYAAIIDE
jgi:hypothetical protein